MAEPGTVDRLVLEVAGRVDSAARELPGYLSGLGALAAAAVTTIAAVTKASADFADATAKAARNAGITTTEYAGLASAASLAGTSTRALLASQVRLATAMQEAATTGGRSGDAFRRLGIDAREAAERGDGFAALLPRILDGLRGIDDSMERTAVGAALLGGGVRTMGTLIEQGSEGLEVGIGLTERWMGALEGSSAASENLNDQITMTQIRLQGLALTMSAQIIPAAGRLAQKLGEIMDEFQPDLETAAEALGEGIGSAIEAIDTPLGRLIGLVGGLGLAGALGTMASRAAGASRATGLLGGILTRMGAVGGPLVALASALALVALAVDDFNEAADGGPSIIGDLADAIGAGSEVQAALAGLRDLLAETGGWLGRLADDLFPGFGDAARSALRDLAGFAAFVADRSAVGAQFVADRSAIGAQFVAEAMRRDRVGEVLAIGSGLPSQQEAARAAIREILRASSSTDLGVREDDLMRRGLLQGPGLGSASVTVSAPITITGALDPVETGRRVEEALGRALDRATDQIERGR